MGNMGSMGSMFLIFPIYSLYDYTRSQRVPQAKDCSVQEYRF